jgi:hypothetical protein
MTIATPTSSATAPTRPHVRPSRQVYHGQRGRRFLPGPQAVQFIASQAVACGVFHVAYVLGLLWGAL